MVSTQCVCHSLCICFSLHGFFFPATWCRINEAATAPADDDTANNGILINWIDERLRYDNERTWTTRTLFLLLCSANRDIAPATEPSVYICVLFFHQFHWKRFSYTTIFAYVMPAGSSHCYTLKRATTHWTDGEWYGCELTYQLSICMYYNCMYIMTVTSKTRYNYVASIKQNSRQTSKALWDGIGSGFSHDLCYII